MKEQIRKYTTESGTVYTQTKHYDEKEDFVGEFWERKSDKGAEIIDLAVYISEEMTHQIATEYSKYKEQRKFGTGQLRKLISLGRHEHYKGKSGRIIYLYQGVSIYASTTVEQIEPGFE